ncbi:hypothetical protein BX666DRAFT_1976037 [Dichotomocladium elegans]|nr:hypothetical protein BX666DRAFT_1976037 [Dichotomocladium elegans]
MLDSDDEDYECPLCMEELDIADRNFKPCTCGYQICRFCWHHIRENLNGRCPACRREYSDQMAEFEPISADEIARIKREKKEKERQQKDMEAANRRHLANMRVVQKNLVYVIGLHPKLATEETIRSNDFFGQFGKIAKVVINKRPVAPTSNASGTTTMQPSAAVYVTYQRKEDAAKAIHGVDGSVMAGRILRASYGTTKYCTYYLRNMTCPNPTCLYLHEPGEEADTISKEELATGKHRMRDQMSTDADRAHIPATPSVANEATSRRPATLESVANITYKSTTRAEPSYSKPTTVAVVEHSDDDRPALPATASWAKAGSGPSTPVLRTGTLPERSLTPDNFGPPLAVAVAAAAAQKQQQQQQQAASAARRKTEKKKRREMKGESNSSGSRPATPTALLEHPESSSTSINGNGSEDLTNGVIRPCYLYDGLIGFVLGDALNEVCSLSLHEDDDIPVGVGALHEDDGDDHNKDPRRRVKGDENGRDQPLRLLMEDEDDTLDDPDLAPMSALDFLANATPTPSYTGTFNPFTHQILRSTGGLFETPMRKCSRFGFAQI